MYTSDEHNKIKLKIALFLMRMSISVVLLLWSLDKLFNTNRVKDFYPDWSISITTLLGVLELALAITLLLGLYKTLSYGAALSIHSISTILPFENYLDPFDAKINLLYFTAWPMLAACISIFLLRHEDTLFTAGNLINKFRR